MDILKGEEFNKEIHVDNLDLRLSKIEDDITAISAKLDKFESGIDLNQQWV